MKGEGTILAVFCDRDETGRIRILGSRVKYEDEIVEVWIPGCKPFDPDDKGGPTGPAAIMPRPRKPEKTIPFTPCFALAA